MLLTTEERRQLYKSYLVLYRDIRRVKMLSQAKVAERAGLCQKYITMIENGKRIPSLECIVALLSVVEAKRSVAERIVADLLDQFEWSAED